MNTRYGSWVYGLIFSVLTTAFVATAAVTPTYGQTSTVVSSHVFIDSITISGDRKTRKALILRELEFAPGDSIELRFEMDTLIVLNTCRHPLDPDPEYRHRHVKLEVFAGDPAAADDPCFAIRPENFRAWENNQTYHSLRF